MISVSLKNLQVIRGGKIILSNLSLNFQAGVITGLLGPSGSGKSTILRSIVGIQKISNGNLEVLGELAGSKPLRKKIGYLPQSASIYSDLTCLENLHFFARIMDASDISVSEILDLVDLTKNRKQLVSTLSGGERARLALGAALLGDPELLVLDEPTVGLDPVLRIELWSIFHSLAEGGKTLIVSSHVMDEADRCDTLVLLRDGKVLATGTPQELRTRTGTPDMESAFVSLVSRQ